MTSIPRLFCRVQKSPGDEDLFYLVQGAEGLRVLHQSSYRHGNGRRDRKKYSEIAEFLSRERAEPQKALLALMAQLLDREDA